MLRGIIAKMKNAANFLNYPILQYIPISINPLAQNAEWSNPFNLSGPQFFLFQDSAALKSALTRLQIKLNSTPPEEELYVICLNFRAELVLFRYLTCKIIGQSQGNNCHVFSLTKKYFPRRFLHFGLFENDGRKLRSINFEIY
ncbi:MAG: hypothetical protein KGZ54_06085 [Dethiobacter sp.]|jgi:hypothetical protein|nr:hypothetical protein [Dethiobacter sp.]MBS3901571.1 hypothetical protein [Dethiobacter sp.]MBS3989407.1 hypothetical protein [Dethiobacter sp.]